MIYCLAVFGRAITFVVTDVNTEVNRLTHSGIRPTVDERRGGLLVTFCRTTIGWNPASIQGSGGGEGVVVRGVHRRGGQPDIVHSTDVRGSLTQRMFFVHLSMAPMPDIKSALPNVGLITFKRT